MRRKDGSDATREANDKRSSADRQGQCPPARPHGFVKLSPPMCVAAGYRTLAAVWATRQGPRKDRPRFRVVSTAQPTPGRHRSGLLACLLACRGLVEGLGLLSGLVSAIRRAEVLRHAGQYRELSTPVGTAGNDPSQTWHGVRDYWDLHFPASRYSAPPASVGARPATGTSTGSATSSPASL